MGEYCNRCRTPCLWTNSWTLRNRGRKKKMGALPWWLQVLTKRGKKEKKFKSYSFNLAFHSVSFPFSLRSFLHTLLFLHKQLFNGLLWESTYRTSHLRKQRCQRLVFEARLCPPPSQHLFFFFEQHVLLLFFSKLFSLLLHSLDSQVSVSSNHTQQWKNVFNQPTRQSSH